MPITKSGQDEAPTWCELSYFEVVSLAASETREFARRGKREKIIVGAGQCRIQRGGQAVEGDYKTNVDLEGDGDYFEVTAGDGPTTLVWMCGDWEDEVRSYCSGLSMSSMRPMPCRANSSRAASPIGRYP